jgi:hypothetical protein
MIISSAADTFAQQFTGLIQKYKDHREDFSLQMKRKERGQVYLAILHRKMGYVVQDLLTPPQFNPGKSLTGWMWSWERDACASKVLTNLFFKTVGLVCDNELEKDRYGELTTLHSVLSAAQEPPRREAEQALEQYIPVYQIVHQLTAAPLLSYCEQFLQIESRDCTIVKGDTQAARPEGKLIDWIWSLCKPDLDTTPLPDEKELLHTIVVSEDVRCSLIRALALAMCRDAALPIQRYLETTVPATQQQRWNHRFHYTIFLPCNYSPSVIQNVESLIRVQGQERPALAVRWMMTLAFDNKFSIDHVKSTVDSVEGISPQLREEMTYQCTGGWSRPFLGNIETLFYHTPLTTCMTWQMEAQANVFEFIGFPDKKKEDGFLHPNLNFLLETFDIPQEIREKAFDQKTNEFDRYLRESTDPRAPLLMSILIAVSHLPFVEVTQSISLFQPSSEPWTHQCTKINIIQNQSQTTIVQHGISECKTEEKKNEGSSTWSLIIVLSDRGQPSEISFRSAETGRAHSIPRSSVHRFIAPSHQMYRSIHP